MKGYLIACFFGLFFCANALFGQVAIYEESDISAQNLLISAKKQVILGKLDKAIPIYVELLTEYGQIVAAYELSRIHLEKKDFSQAEKYARQAYENDAGNEWYVVQLTDVLIAKDENLEVAKIFDTYSKANPYNEYYFLQASFYYLKAEEYKESLKVLNDLEKNIGITEQVIQRKFEILDAVNKPKDALKELQKLSEMYPNQTRYLHNIAGYLRTMNKESEANKIMVRILEIDPDDETALLFTNSKGKNKDANYLRSLVPVIKDERINLDKKIVEIIPYIQDFADNGNDELGQSLLDISSIMDENYPSNAKVKSILGDIYFYQKNWSEAVKNYQLSVNLDKSIWPVWSQLFLSLALDKNFEQMEILSNDAIDVYPNQVQAYYYNGLAFLENGKITDAEMAIMEAQLIGGDQSPLAPNIYYLQSRLNIERKNFVLALQNIEKSITANPNENPTHLELLGDINWALEKPLEAKKSWTRAIKAGGNSERLKKKISGESILNN